MPLLKYALHCSRLSPSQRFCHPVQYPVRHLSLAHQGKFFCLAVAAYYSHFIGVSAEAAFFVRNIIGDDEVKLFLLQLLLGVGDKILTLGGKANLNKIALDLSDDIRCSD